MIERARNPTMGTVSNPGRCWRPAFVFSLALTTFGGSMATTTPSGSIGCWSTTAFTITLDPRSDLTTTLRIETYYTPRNPLYGLLNRLVLRRVRRTVDGLLQGLKQISERRGAQRA